MEWRVKNNIRFLREQLRNLQDELRNIKNDIEVLGEDIDYILHTVGLIESDIEDREGEDEN